MRWFDPRHFQIIILSFLLIMGWRAGFLEIMPENALIILCVAQLSQACFCRAFNVKYDARSAFISSLSLIILLRTNYPLVAAVAAFIAISSKFLIRSDDGKHVFNPTNFALVCVSLFGGMAWVSTGQWGAHVWLSFLLVCLGGLVLSKTRQLDVSLAFLLSYGAMLVGRAIYLGDPMAIPLHQMQNGALLLFAFFMISDPMTIPNARVGRILFAIVVAALTFVLQFAFYIPVAMIYALIIAMVSVPFFDRIFVSKKYQWNI